MHTAASVIEASTSSSTERVAPPSDAHTRAAPTAGGVGGGASDGGPADATAAGSRNRSSPAAAG